MELLDMDDPVKGRLLKKSAMHQKQLEEEVRLISDKTQKIVTTALVVGGALAATYLLVSSFSGPRKKKRRAAKIRVVQDRQEPEVIHATAEPEGPSVVAQIGTALASQATVFLLSLAKEKLMEYMQSQAVKNSDTDEAAQ